MNKAGAALAREEAGDGAVVAGDIGPSGEIFEPMGSLKYDEAVEGFRRQAEGLVAGGADCFWIETMSDLKEVRAAVEGARLAAPDLPVVATMTFDTRGFTMSMGSAFIIVAVNTSSCSCTRSVSVFSTSVSHKVEFSSGAKS